MNFMRRDERDAMVFLGSHVVYTFLWGSPLALVQVPDRL